MLSKYQLKIADFLNFPIHTVYKFVPNCFDKEKYALHYQNMQRYVRLGLKLKTIHHVLEFSQSQWLKLYVEFNTQKGAEKNGGKDGKGSHELMKSAVYGKTMENLRNRNDVRLVSNEKDYLKWTSKSRQMSYKMFDND